MARMKRVERRRPDETAVIAGDRSKIRLVQAHEGSKVSPRHGQGGSPALAFETHEADGGLSARDFRR